MTDLSSLPVRDRAEAKCMLDELRTIEGGKILSAGGVVESGDECYPASFWPALVIDCGDGRVRTVIIQRDSEGNGPGFARIEAQ